MIPVSTSSNLSDKHFGYLSLGYNSNFDLVVQSATLNIPVTITAAFCASIPNILSESPYEFTVRLGAGAFAGICLTVIDFFCAKMECDRSPAFRVFQSGLHIATNSLSYSWLTNCSQQENEIILCSYLSGVVYQHALVGRDFPQKEAYQHPGAIGHVGSLFGGLAAAALSALIRNFFTLCLRKS